MFCVCDRTLLSRDRTHRDRPWRPERLLTAVALTCHARLYAGGLAGGQARPAPWYTPSNISIQDRRLRRVRRAHRARGKAMRSEGLDPYAIPRIAIGPSGTGRTGILTAALRVVVPASNPLEVLQALRSLEGPRGPPGLSRLSRVPGR
jgi:hypothetical protein